MVKWMTTPELTSPLLTSTPTRDRLSLDIFNVHRSPLQGGSSGVLDSNACHACHEFVTLTTGLPRPFLPADCRA
ncbi:hypothetical protein TNCV_3643571 [Trichonephila clavipes]|nr:hypothetical protein TNCV_3643571 [Trichonephila clavipes]